MPVHLFRAVPLTYVYPYEVFWMIWVKHFLVWNKPGETLRSAARISGYAFPPAGAAYVPLPVQDYRTQPMRPPFCIYNGRYKRGYFLKAIWQAGYRKGKAGY